MLGNAIARILTIVVLGLGALAMISDTVGRLTHNPSPESSIVAAIFVSAACISFAVLEHGKTKP